MVKRISAILLIYLCTAAAWIALGISMDVRTQQQNGNLKTQVGQLWGSVHRQQAPLFYSQTELETTAQTVRDGKTFSEVKKELVKHPLPLSASQIQVDLNLRHRRKGLLWYSTYGVQFDGKYEIRNPFQETSDFFVDFVFPGQGAVYDRFRFNVGGKDIQNVQITTGRVTHAIRLNPGETKVVHLAYNSQGMDEWSYEFGEFVTQVNNFSLTMKTDFQDINFSEHSISPSEKTILKNGWQLRWRYASLLSGIRIGMTMPHKLNPGPWVGRVTKSAPVSLFLFFFMLLIFTTIRKLNLHPMNYFFLGASFFSFHLLLAYMVDHVSIHLSFLICSVVSIGLVVSYMKLVLGKMLFMNAP